MSWGYADDLALAVTKLCSLGPLLKHIEQFNAASGSSSSPTKTYLVSTRNVPKDELQRLIPLPWTIQTRDSAKYLGILLGRDVTVSDIFAAPLAELQPRTEQYLPSKTMYSLTNRIIIANAFLSPILSFHQRFFLMPAAVTATARAAIREWVSPGRLLGYDHLCRDTASGGLAQPLRDVHVLNVSSLLSRRIIPSAVALSMTKHNNDIERHIHQAGRVFETHCKHPPPQDSLRSDIFLRLQKAQHFGLKALSNQIRSRRQTDPDNAKELAKAVFKNLQNLPQHTPHLLKYHGLRLIFNALPTRMRTRHWAGNSGKSTQCPLCDEGLDALSHLHTECKVTHQAKGKIFAHCSEKSIIDNLTMADNATFSLLSPQSPLQSLHIIAFSHALWSARNLPNKGHPELVKHIQETFNSHLNAAQPRPRKRRNRTAEKQEFEALYNTLANDSLRYFTDGSSLGNPGPSGAGVVCFYEHKLIYSKSKALGISTNNIAELEGLLIALLHAITWSQERAARPRKTIYIFCDNRYAISVTDGRWTARSHRSLVKQLQDSLVSLRKLTSVHLYWVPGHADIAGNEAADQLAKQGANLPASLPPDPSLTDPTPPSPNLPDLTTPPVAKKPRTEDQRTALDPSRAGNAPARRGQRTRQPVRKLFPGVDFSAIHQTSRKRPRTDEAIVSSIFPTNRPPLQPCIHGCLPIDRISLPKCPLCVEDVRRLITLPESSHVELPELPWPEPHTAQYPYDLP